MQRRSRAQWRDIVGKWKASGESAGSFASRNGLNAGTMKWWSYQFRAEDRQAADEAGCAELVEVVTFAPAVRVNEFETANSRF